MYVSGAIVYEIIKRKTGGKNGFKEKETLTERSRKIGGGIS